MNYKIIRTLIIFAVVSIDLLFLVEILYYFIDYCYYYTENKVDGIADQLPVEEEVTAEKEKQDFKEKKIESIPDKPPVEQKVILKKEIESSPDQSPVEQKTTIEKQKQISNKILFFMIVIAVILVDVAIIYNLEY